MSATVYNFITERDKRRPSEARGANYAHLRWHNEKLVELREEIEHECYIQGFGLDMYALNNEAQRRLDLIVTRG